MSSGTNTIHVVRKALLLQRFHVVVHGFPATMRPSRRGFSRPIRFGCGKTEPPHSGCRWDDGRVGFGKICWKGPVAGFTNTERRPAFLRFGCVGGVTVGVSSERGNRRTSGPDDVAGDFPDQNCECWNKPIRLGVGYTLNRINYMALNLRNRKPFVDL